MKKHDIIKLPISERPGTFRGTPVSDVKSDEIAYPTDKNDITKQGPGKAKGFGLTGSKGGVQEGEELPMGDETLPWRRKTEKSTKIAVTKQQLQIEQQVTSQQAQPWTQEAITLKKTVREKKEVQKETLEQVELKPSKPQKRAVPKEELEQVDLKPFKKDEQTATDITEATKLERQTFTSDQTLLKVDEREDTNIEKLKSKKTKQHKETTEVEELETRDWRKRKVGTTQRKDSITVVQTEETETTILDRKRKDAGKITQTHVEDTTLLQIQESEKDDVTKISQVRDWRKQRKDVHKTDETTEKPATALIHTEDTALLQIEETKKEDATKISQIKDWRRGRKDVQKSEQISDLKPTETPTTLQFIEDRTLLKIKEGEKEDIKETPQEKDWRKPRTQKESKIPEEIKIEETSEPIPWNKQEIKLKKAPKVQKDVQKEKVEEIQLKPTKQQPKTTSTQEIEQVDLKPTKLQLPKQEDITITPSKGTEVISMESKRETDDSKILKIDDKLEEMEKDEQLTAKSWRKPKKPEAAETQPSSIKEEVVPWTQESVKLKQVLPQKKPVEKESTEGITLTPFKVPVKDESIPAEETQRKDTPEQVKESTLIVDEQKPVKKPDVDKISQPKEEIPWNKQPIQLKKTYKEKKILAKEALEQVELKPVEKVTDKNGENEERKETEVSNILKVTEESTDTETKSNKKTKEWRKPEDTTATKEETGVSKQEPVKPTEKIQITVKPVQDIKTEIASLNEVEDSNIISLNQAIDESTTKPDLKARGWRKPRKQEEKVVKDEDKISETKVKEKIQIVPSKPTDVEEKPVEEQPKKPSEDKTTVQKTIPREEKEDVPWNLQKIQLKKTHKEKKTIETETLEKVDLKPIPKKEVSDKTDVTKDVDQSITVVEDSSILTLDVTSAEDTSKPKRKTVTEDNIQEEKLETRPWRKPRKPQLQETTDLEAKPELKLVIDETVDTTDIVTQSETEIKSWRKPTKSKLVKDADEVVEKRNESLTETPQTKEIEQVDLKESEYKDTPQTIMQDDIRSIIEKKPKKKVDKQESVIPWNEEKVELKRTPKLTKEAHEKQQIDTALKPVEKETTSAITSAKEDEPTEAKTLIVEETVTEVEDTIVLKVDKKAGEVKTKEDVEKKSAPWRSHKAPEKITEDKTIIENEDTKLKQTKKSSKPKEEDDKEVVQLKPIPKKKTEETIKETQLPEDKTIIKEELHLKPKEQILEEKIDDTKVSVVKDDKLVEDQQPEETERKVPWRRDKTPKTITAPKETSKLKLGKGKLPEDENVGEEVHLKPIPKKEIPDRTDETHTDVKEKIPVSLIKDEEKTKIKYGKGKLPEDEISKEEVHLKPIHKKQLLEEKPDETKTDVVDKLTEDQQPKETERTVPWRRDKKPKPSTVPEETPKLKLGKGKLPEDEKIGEEVHLKPIPKKEIPEKTDEILTDIKEKKPLPSLMDEEKPTPKPGKGKLPEDEITKEEVHLKPIPKKKIPEKKIEQESDTTIKERTTPVPTESNKHSPEHLEEKQIVGDEQPVDKDKSLPWRREKKAKQEPSPEETSKIPMGKGKLPEEEIDQEEVHLKPIPKKNVFEKKTRKDIDTTFDEKSMSVPSEIETHSPEESVVSEKPIDEKPVPWRREKKTKPETIPEDKPKLIIGKGELPEDKSVKEEVHLKPVPRKVPEKVSETEETDTTSKLKIRKGKLPKDESAKDKVDLIPVQMDKQTDTKPSNDMELKPTIENVPEIIPVQKRPKKGKVEDDKEETKVWPTGKMRPKEEAESESVELKPVPKRKKPEESQQENVTAIKPKEEKAELTPVQVTDRDTSQDLCTISESTYQIKLTEKETEQEVTLQHDAPKEIVTEEEDISQKEMKIKVTSKKAVKDKRRVRYFDEEQPLPELEIISQKKTLEGVDKVAEESLTEDVEIKDKTTHKTVMQITKKQTKKVKPKPPKFTQRVEPVAAEKDKPARLICKVEGTPFPEIAWYKNEVLLQASERVQPEIFEDTVTLNFANVMPQDVAIYSCKATNPAGVATSTANLVILGTTFSVLSVCLCFCRSSYLKALLLKDEFYNCVRIKLNTI